MASETGVLRFSIEFDDKGTVKIKNAKGEVVKLEKQTKKSTGFMGKQFGGLWKQIVGGQIAFNLLRSSVMTLGRALKGAFTDAIDFEKELANVSTLVDTSIVNMAEMGEGILDLAGELGSAQELTKGLYQALSAGVDPAKGIDFIAEAAKFARAGLTDMFTAVDAITTAINAYGLEVEQAGNVSDIFFEVIKKGKITGQQLAGSIGLVISSAAQMDIGLKEVGAAIALMTKVGIPAERAMVSLNQTMMAVLKPSEDAMKAAKQYGVELSRAGIKGAGGFQKWLEKLKFAVGDNERAMARMFPNVRALRAVFSLTGKAAGEYKNILEGMDNVTENTNIAFEKQIRTFSGAADAIKNKLSAVITRNLLPALQTMAKWLRDNGDNIKTFFEGVVDAVGALVNVIKGALTVLKLPLGLLNALIKDAIVGWTKLIILFDNKLDKVYKKVIDSTVGLAKTQKQVFDRMIDLKKATGLTNKEWVKLIANYKHIKDPVNRYNQMMVDFKKGKYDKEFDGLSKAVKTQTDEWKAAVEPIQNVTDQLKEVAEAVKKMGEFWKDAQDQVDFGMWKGLNKAMDDMWKKTEDATKGNEDLSDSFVILKGDLIKINQPIKDNANELESAAGKAQDLANAFDSAARVAQQLSGILGEGLANALENVLVLTASVIAGDIPGIIAGVIGVLTDIGEAIFGASDEEMERRRAEGIRQAEEYWEKLKGIQEKGVNEFTKFLRSGLVDSENFNASMNIVLRNFATLAQQGKSFPEIFEIMGEQFDILGEKMKELGLEGNETFNKLLAWREFTVLNKELLNGINALSNAMLAMAEGNMITTQEAFNDFQTLAISNFDKLIAAGATEEQALLAMLPTLRILNELQKEHNFILDENIQKQIDLANEQGLLDQVDPMKEMVRLLGLLVDHFVGLTKSISDAVDEVKRLNEGFDDLDREPGKNNIIQMPQRGIPGFARGAHFTIPSGFEDDSFLMKGKTGEDVQITPPGGVNKTGNVQGDRSFAIGNVTIMAKDEDTGRDIFNKLVEGIRNNEEGLEDVIQEVAAEVVNG